MKRRKKNWTTDPEDYFAFVEEEMAPARPKPEKPKKRERSRHLADDLPDDLPVLTKDDLLLYRSQERDGVEKHHLTTWLDLCLPADYYSRVARNKLCAAIMDVTWKTWGYNGIGPSFIPLDDQAAIWNSALKKLGYPVAQHNCLVLGPQRIRKES
mgnify:CR=1 FL=1